MAKKPAKTTVDTLRQRILRTELMPASRLKRNPQNFRKHGETQRRDVASLLTNIGQIAPVIARELPDGTIELIDGELRSNIADDKQILVAVTDLDAQEAATMLAMLDWTSAQATIDPELARQVADAAKGQPGISDETWALWGQSVDVVKEQRAEEALAAIVTNATAEQARNPTPRSEAPQYQTFTCPLTLAQETLMRDVIRVAKAKFHVETTGEALSAMAKEWHDGNK